jgi:predicted RNase H-like HicB family nuclease
VEAMINKYRISIYWSEEDQVFIAEVPELPGCMTHGDTRTTARANAKKAIQAWIDTASEFGDHIPRPKEDRGTFNRLAEVSYKSIISGRKVTLRKRNPRNFFHPKALQPTANPAAH